MSEDFSKAINERCGASHDIKALSIFSVIATSLSMIFTIPLNALIVFVLVKDRKEKRYKSLFYKLLLNIAIADLLTGLVTDTISVAAIIKEVIVANLSDMEIYFAHLSLFFTDAVALCSLTLLSVDRTIAIVTPIKHFQGVRPVAKHVLIASTWIVGFCLVLPYFGLGFIRQLLFFSSINIGVAILSLLVTIVMYKLKLKPSQRVSASAKIVDRNRVAASGNNNKLRHVETSFNEPLSIHSISTYDASKSMKETLFNKSTSIQSLSQTGEIRTGQNDSGEIKTEKSCIDINTSEKSPTKITTNTKVIGTNYFGKLSKKNSKVSKTTQGGGTSNNLLSKQQKHDQQKATRSFFIMLCVFLISYFPTAITMILMNTCMTCSCKAVHVMRDVSIVSILTSSVFRPLNFILTLKHLRTAVFRTLGIRKKSKVVNTETISSTSGSKITSN